MRQRILNEVHLARLMSDLEYTLPYYSEDSSWLDTYFGSRSGYSTESRIEISSPLSLVLPSGQDRFDIENAKIVFDTFRGLNRVQASDKRLWAYICHVDCWEYMHLRWGLDPKRDDKKNVNIVRSRYFVESNASRALLRNGVARLWWFGHLTFDENRNDDGFGLTRILLQYQDIAQSVLERSLGRSRNILIGFLEYLEENIDLLESGTENRLAIRDLVKSLNLHGGSSILDDMDVGDVKKFLDSRRVRS